MISEIGELYQEVIIDHSKRPRNFRVLERPDRKAEGYNPLCGDRLVLYLKMDGERIAEIAFQGSGCAISTASASIMTSELKGKTIKETEEIFERFHQMVTGTPNEDWEEKLGKLAAFSGVSQFPVRVKCASLCWHTLKAALEAKKETVSTE
ncbi:MAG TPA: SUF system NifU family Fe-S cluster assembly protein [candidate division Zixibacteria bacterium]|nr:SUF system NifU family Fe-S cluster assembly protein [candidate division Zixibacteria bacterium]